MKKSDTPHTETSVQPPNFANKRFHANTFSTYLITYYPLSHGIPGMKIYIICIFYHFSTLRPWRLMIWRYKGPGHHQPWYWPKLPGIFWFQPRGVKNSDDYSLPLPFKSFSETDNDFEFVFVEPGVLFKMADEISRINAVLRQLSASEVTSLTDQKMKGVTIFWRKHRSLCNTCIVWLCWRRHW